MTNDWNPARWARRRRRLVLSQTAGASDNAEGVGARLHPFPFPFPFPFPPYLSSIGASPGRRKRLRRRLRLVRLGFERF